MSTLYLTRDEVEPACEHDALEYGEEGWYCVECREFARVKGFDSRALEGAHGGGESEAPSLDPSPRAHLAVNEAPPTSPTPCVDVTLRAMHAGYPMVSALPEEPVCPHGPDCDLEPEDCPRDDEGVPVPYVPGARVEDLEPESPSRTFDPSELAEMVGPPWGEAADELRRDIRRLFGPGRGPITESRHVNGMTYPEDRAPLPTPGAPLRPEDRLAMSAEVAHALRSGLHVAVDLVESAEEPAQQLAALDRLVKLASALDRASTNSHVQGEDTAATVSGVSLSS